jgi:MFS family permease
MINLCVIGINIMSYYLPLVLINSVGLSNNLSRLLTACNATSYFFFACVAVALVEKFGRRGMMIMSGLGQFAAFLVITILLRVAEIHNVYATASVAFFFLYHVAFAIGMLGVPWLYPTEINSLPIRTKGAAVATVTNW